MRILSALSWREEVIVWCDDDDDDDDGDDDIRFGID